jgi:hypothetical protein
MTYCTILLLVAAFLGIATAFQPLHPHSFSSVAASRTRTSYLFNSNPFKGFVDSMESGCKFRVGLCRIVLASLSLSSLTRHILVVLLCGVDAGGDDSPYSKIKQQDAAKRAAKKAANDEKKKRGFTLLADVKEKTFVKPKYEQQVKEDAVEKWAKGAKPAGFKFPWDK